MTDFSSRMSHSMQLKFSLISDPKRVFRTSSILSFLLLIPQTIIPASTKALHKAAPIPTVNYFNDVKISVEVG